MSFILDALKKSESERQRQAAPGIADIPRGQERPRTQRWLLVIVGLLAVNLAVLAGILLMPESAQEPAPATAGTAAPAPATEPFPQLMDQSFSEIVAEAKRNRPEREAPTTTEPQREAPRTEGPAASATPPREQTAAPAPARRSESPTATFDELRATGQLTLPDLHLDVHVYSENPAERFVFINMTRYRERANLKEGPMVREITSDGVVLEQGGTAFLLPRQ